jgi:ATP-dependent RNA helicase SUPV3L1/SUV3
MCISYILLSNFQFEDIKELLNYDSVFIYFRMYINIISQNRSDGFSRLKDFLKQTINDKNLLDELERVRVEQGKVIMYNRLLKYYFSYLQDTPSKLFSQKQNTFLYQLSHTKNQFNFTSPQDWFIPARRMKRKLIVHVGPTNSGKTYRALERLKTSQSGIYCGPLRLLALEVWKKFSDQGIRCNLVTGEERKLIEDGKPVQVTSCTVEMANFNTPIDVAVIDEIQMISDHQRGFAWTRALLGIPAKEIHLCGEPRAVPLIKWIGEKLCEEVEVNTYDRLSPLSITENPKPGVEGIKAGDCIVAFSRKNIFAYKHLIESQTKFKCAVVYGNLPPENRAIQASLFNDKSSGYDVLVASDAVGMGLNLNIQRMIFSKMTKFNGTSIQRISTSMVKQIAGRAGRFGTQYANGIATTFVDADFQILEEEMEKTIPDLTTAWIQPDASLIERATYLFPTLKLDQVLIMLGALAVTGPKFSFEFDYNQLQIAKMLSPLKLPVDVTMTLLFAPFKVRDEEEKAFAYKV